LIVDTLWGMSFLKTLLSPKVLVPLVILLIGGAALLAYLLGKQASQDTPASPPSESEPPVQEEEAEEPVEMIEMNGIIEGSLAFPSEFIPSNMHICAEDTSSKSTSCTNTHISDPKYTNNTGYQLEVPPGSYHVYAYFPNGEGGYDKNYRAYYSVFVTCGMSVDCPSHDPITVTVSVGQTVSEIDPQDWYNF
jgi:hypothetical protein